MGIDAKSQRIGDLEAKLNQANEHLVQSENYNLQLEKELARLTKQVLKLVDKALFGDRCCE